MEQIVNNIIPIALAAVAIVLTLGLWTMLRGDNPGRSQQLMRWRVGLQFIAIVIAMAAIYFSGRTP
ncbi:MAG: twin transmembrane helix small protein [Hyphomicrobiales bacterium]|nr:twin transmembrane helix small protein [Hyphomicrobiales bacterium]